MSLTVTPVSPQSITAWLISTATAGDVVVALNTVAPIGWHGTVTTSVQPNTEPPYVVWNISLSRAGYPNLAGTNGSWIVSDGVHVDILTTGDFLDRYTADVPLVWDAVTSAPDAIAQSGLTALVSCPAPTSANGPWTYSMHLVDGEGNATEHADQPTLANGKLTWPLSGLTVGAQYTGTVSVATQYSGVEATSLPFSFTAAQ